MHLYVYVVLYMNWCTCAVFPLFFYGRRDEVLKIEIRSESLESSGRTVLQNK